MDSSDQIRNPIEELAEEFMQRRRMGENPSVRTYADKHPELADEILDLFPTLEMMEHVRQDVVDKTVVNLDRHSNVGEQLGDYQVLREIGRGGMGVVYEAHQSSLGRRVALKVLSPSLQKNAKYLERFKREAKAAAKLQHANIVPVYGVGEDKGYHYYAMQYIHGRGLDEILTAIQENSEHVTSNASSVSQADDLAGALLTGQFRATDLHDSTTGEAVANHLTSATTRSDGSLGSEGSTNLTYFLRVADLCCQAAGALAHAHNRGMLHRDIKPSNLLLDVYGNLWITDFGLVKLAGEDDLTETGDIVGTLRYISPESLTGRYDARSDVYGLGLTLHELLSREKAFSASHRAELTRQILERGPKSLKHVPRDLATIVNKATAIEPLDRYQTASDLADDLDRFLNHQPIRARSLSPVEHVWRWARRNRMLATSLATVAALLVIGLFGSIFTSFRLNNLAAENQTAFLQAAAEKRDAQRRLVEANILLAEDRAKSGLPGQRLDGLKAIAESVHIARNLNMGEATILRLRNAAITCMANCDVEPIRDWRVTSATHFLAAFDRAAQTYAVQTYPGSPIEIRSTIDDSQIAQFTSSESLSHLWLSPDGTLLAARNGNQITIWQIDSGQILHRLDQADYSYARFQFDPTSSRFAISTVDGWVRVFDVANQQPIMEQRKNANCLCFIGKHQLAVGRERAPENLFSRIRDSLGSDSSTKQMPRGMVEIYAIKTGQRTQKIPAIGNPINICASEKLIAVAGSVGEQANALKHRPNTIVEVFEGPSYDRVSFADHNRVGIPALMQIVGNERYLALGFNAGNTELWDIRTGTKSLITDGEFVSGADNTIAYRRMGYLGINRLKLSPEFRGLLARYAPQRIKVDVTNRIGFAPTDHGLYLFDVRSGSVLERVDNRIITNVTINPDGSCFYVVTRPGSLHRWPIEYNDDQVTIGPPSLMEVPDGLALHHLAIDHSGTVLAAESPLTNRVVALSTDSSFEPIVMTTPASPLFVAISPNARWLATGTWHGAHVGVYDLQKKEMVHQIPFGRTQVGFTPDNKGLFCGGGRLINLEDWSERPVMSDDNSFRIESPVMPSDGSFLIISEQKPLGSSFVFDPETWQELARLRIGKNFREQAAGISPNGHHLFVTTIDDTHFAVSTWNLYEIRQRLKTMDLDWDGPPLDSPVANVSPVKLVVKNKD